MIDAKLDIVGQVYKGGPKGTNMPGKDNLGENFRFVTDNPIIEKMFLANVKGAKKDKGTLLFKKITIAFPFRNSDPIAEIHDNFPVQYEAYESKQFVRSCNGKNITLINEEGNLTKCLLECQQAKGCRDKKNGACRKKGDLMFFVQELMATKKTTYDVPFGVVSMPRGSKIDIAHIEDQLRNIQILYKHRTGGSITGVPLILRKKLQSISTGADRHGRSDKWMVYLTIAPSFLKQQLLDLGGKIDNIYTLFANEPLPPIAPPPSKDMYSPTDILDKMRENNGGVLLTDSNPPTTPMPIAPTAAPPIDSTVDTVVGVIRPSTHFDFNIDESDPFPLAPIVLDSPPTATDPPTAPIVFDPSPINKYLKQADLEYPETFQKDPLEVGITAQEKNERLKHHQDELYSEIFSAYSIVDTKAKEYLKKCGTTSFNHTKVKYYYQLMACSIAGSMAIVNALTDNKYGHKKHYIRSYNKADEKTKQGWPKPMDGQGWSRVIDLLLARHEGQNLAGDETLEAGDFTKEMYTDPLEVGISPQENNEPIPDLQDYESDTGTINPAPTHVRAVAPFIADDGSEQIAVATIPTAEILDEDFLEGFD